MHEVIQVIILITFLWGHPNVGKAKHDVSSTYWDLHVPPVTSHLMSPTLHPSGMYGPQDV